MSMTESPGGDPIYLLSKPGDIIEKLRLMQKSRSVLTLTCGDSGHKIGTIIVAVLPDKGVVALDLGANPAANRRLLNIGRARCETHVNGIEARFDVDGIREASLNGQTLLAAAIPDSLYWLQRRSFYRVVVPPGRIIKCRAMLPDAGSREFAIHNISVVGMALLDSGGVLRQWAYAGQVFGPCRLLVAGLDDEEFALEIRSRVEPARAGNLLATMRIGAAFRGVKRTFEVKLQKYIFELEREFRRDND